MYEYVQFVEIKSTGFSQVPQVLAQGRRTLR
jgi:hypothetical protein